MRKAYVIVSSCLVRRLLFGFLLVIERIKACVEETEVHYDHTNAKEKCDNLDENPHNTQVCVVEAPLIVFHKFCHSPSTQADAT